MGDTETGFETGAARVELEGDILVLRCLHVRVEGGTCRRGVVCCRGCRWWLGLGRTGGGDSFLVLERNA
jgi:hypothetical protein